MEGRIGRSLRWLARGANLQVVIATAVALSLFGYVLDIASHGDLGGWLGEMLGRIGLIALVLAVPYFALRAATWHLLLGQVGVKAPLRRTVAAFCAGELTKSLPGGVYLETYVLARMEHLTETMIVDAAVATTGMDVMVGTVAFLTAMAIGLPGGGWFRWLLIAAAAAWVVVFGLAWGVIRWWRPHERPGAPAWVRAAGRMGREAGRGAARLVRPAALRPLATTAGSLLIYAVLLWLVLDAVGLSALGFVAAVSVVMITSLANDLLPIPTELGLTEITGVGVLGAYGVPAPDAAIVMIGYRVLTTGALTLVVLGVMAILRGTYARGAQGERAGAVQPGP
jgi:uncharacterized membrane protein YbhN (UPF0104 family)